MAETFEMYVLGIPRSPDSRSCAGWQQTVRAAAWEFWPYLHPPVETEISAVVVYFYQRSTLIDVDNLAKPILDALRNVAYLDDRQVSHLVARKTELRAGLELAGPSLVLARAIETARVERSDVIYVKIGPPPSHEDVP
jgi:Holliday junction resolvase RusA-like endonuclease